MKGIWRGDTDPFSLIEGKEYVILRKVWDGNWVDVIDETGDNYLYPAEDFDITENGFFCRETMIPRIKSVKVEPDYQLTVIFDNGTKVLYDVKEDISAIPSYKDLVSVCGLFEQIQIDQSRTCVFWNDNIDLPSDTLYAYGKVID